jgi:hypothetical protein
MLIDLVFGYSSRTMRQVQLLFTLFVPSDINAIKCCALIVYVFKDSRAASSEFSQIAKIRGADCEITYN